MGFSHLSLGVKTEFLISDNTRLAFDLTTYLPSGRPWEQDLRPVNPSSFDSTVASEMRLSGFQLNVSYKWYFRDDYASELAFYMPYGLGFNYFRFKETIDGGYNKDTYGPPQYWESDTYRESLVGLSIRAGIGLDIPLKEKHLLYTELSLSYSLFSLGLNQNTFRIPDYLNLKAGYRFEFD